MIIFNDNFIIAYIHCRQYKSLLFVFLMDVLSFNFDADNTFIFNYKFQLLILIFTVGSDIHYRRERKLCRDDTLINDAKKI